jgi:hypothetical protein
MTVEAIGDVVQGQPLKLQQITSWDDDRRITRIGFVLADHSDVKERTQWVEAQFSVELPLSRNGALLREEVLGLLRDKVAELSADYGRMVRP